MSNMTEKMQKFVAARVAGIAPRQAGLLAGYSASTVESAVSRLMKREDVRRAIAAAKKKGKSKPNSDDNEDDTGAFGLKTDYPTGLALLQAAYNNPRIPVGLRLDCAKQALPYESAKIGETGKKEKQKEKAGEIAGGGKFKPKKPPRIAESNVTPIRKVGT